MITVTAMLVAPKNVGAALVAHRDTPPAFWLREHGLDLMAPPIQSLAACCEQLARGSRWLARRGAAPGDSFAECATVIAFVGDKRVGKWQHWIDQRRTDAATHLSLYEMNDNWPAGANATRVQSGVQPLFRAVDHHAVERVLLPRLNHHVTSDGIRVCNGLTGGQTGHGTGSSSISVSLP